MSQQSDMPTVLIVGAGPTGLVLAIELIRRGISCRIIDKESHPSMISKALVIHARTLEVCEQMGIIDEMMTQGCPIRYFNIYSNGRALVNADFQKLKSPYPLMLNLDQSQTERILHEHLKLLGAQVERSVELVSFVQDTQKVVAILRHKDGMEEHVSASWLIGCDGAHSIVRQQLAVPFVGDASAESFIFVDGRVDGPLPSDGMHLFLHPDGFFGIFPLPRGRHRLVIRKETAEEHDQLPVPTEAELQRYLTERGPKGTTLHDIAWVSHFHSRERIVKQYRHERVFLAGDAAHIHSPAGGQGMNTGIQDAYNLAWKLAFVEQQLAPVSILDTYEEERLPIAQLAIRSSRALLQLNSLQNPISKFLRNSLISFIGKLNILPINILERISAIGANYRNSSLVQQVHSDGQQFSSASKHVLPGDRAPDATVIYRGQSRRLFELFQETNYTLLLFAGKKHNDQDWLQWQALANRIQTRYGDLFTIFFVLADNDFPATIVQDAVVFDSQDDLHSQYGVRQPCLYLIRPDTYIGFRSQPILADALLNYIQKTCPYEKDDASPLLVSTLKESHNNF